MTVDEHFTGWSKATELSLHLCMTQCNRNTECELLEHKAALAASDDDDLTNVRMTDMGIVDSNRPVRNSEQESVHSKRIHKDWM